MATEWLVVVYDKPGVDRLVYRDEHLAGLPAKIASGKVKSVGPLFKDKPVAGQPPVFVGSTYHLALDTREEVVEYLKQDVFYKQGIWDVEHAIIHPLKVAAREAHAFGS